MLKAWRSIMEEWEQTAKQFKSNAEFLESLCQDKLTHLYQDKRKARKNYQEEHQKIATQFTNVSPHIAFLPFAILLFLEAIGHCMTLNCAVNFMYECAYSVKSVGTFYESKKRKLMFKMQL